MNSRLNLFAAAIFLSAFLLFQVQPLIGKYVLPWYGGAQAVWTTCLLVFQSLLFGGYLYAHLISKLSARVQTILHAGVLLLAAAVPIVPGDAWKPEGGENPLWRIVVMLLTTVGLPFFALAATGPLLQAWFWRVRPDRSPYPLYALSNAGSLIALLSYPILVEPNLSGSHQAAVWRMGFLVFLPLCATAAWFVGRSAGDSDSTNLGTKKRHSTKKRRGLKDDPFSFGTRARELLWIAWSACGVIMFMATTNQMTLNIASVPFLWVLPLSIYLLTFILAFGSRRWYAHNLFAILLVVALVAFYTLLDADVNYGLHTELTFSILEQVASYAGALFVVCLVCNGELVRLKPPPERLTSFYLSIAGGGALGGIFVGVLAPLLLVLYQELQLGMLFCCVLYLVTATRDSSSFLCWRRRRWTGILAAIGLLVFAGSLISQTRFLLKDSIDTSRNFFGVLRVVEVGKGNPRYHAFMLLDGAIAHGYQMADPDGQHIPTLYYARITGIGQALLMKKGGGGRRVGIVGLGVGTLAAYGRPGDLFRFYEINPDVVDAAQTHFTFLEKSLAKVDIVLGDARLNMEREPGQQFDFLILDAFSSDSIPVHLLTVEAVEVYERHLKPDGVLALHVSNLHFDLASLVHRLAEARHLQALSVENEDRPDRLSTPSNWMFLSRTAGPLREIADSVAPLVRSGDIVTASRAPEGRRDIRAWTDNYNHLYHLLKR